MLVGSLNFSKGVEISFTLNEEEIMDSTSFEDLVLTCFEMQSQDLDLVLSKVVSTEASKSSATTTSKLKNKLVESTSSLKATLEATLM